MEFLQGFLSNHWTAVGIAVVALIVWTLGNYLKRKVLVYIGIGLCVLSVLGYLHVFDFLFQH